MWQQKLEKKLASSHALIITHVYGTGPPQDLETYLTPRTASLLVISHPLFSAKNQSSTWKKYQQGKLIKSGHKHRRGGPAVLIYIQDILLTLRWALRLHSHYNVTIAANGLNTVCALFLRLLKRTSGVVFYCIDWVPQRFPNPLLNWIYHQLDSLAARQATTVWNLSPRMAVARQQRGITKTARQLTVPVGIWLNRFPHPRPNRLLSKKIVFMGHLRSGQGLALLLPALRIIHQKFPEAHIDIVGSGPLESKLRTQAKMLELTEAITFHGFIPDHHHLEQILQQADIAVAPYEPNSFTYYTDPGKPKVYLASGLPVIITNIPAIAHDIAARQAGVIIPYQSEALAEAVIKLFSHPDQLRTMRMNAYAFAASFDWENIFPQALADTLRETLY